MSTTYVQSTHMATASRAYPEVVKATREQTLKGLRRGAEQAGLDVTTEEDLTWPTPSYYRWQQISEDEAEQIFCSEDESTFTIISVEATYGDA